MKRLKIGWFKDQYKEYFFILTNVGLVYFHKMTSIQPRGFIPILGATVSKVSKDNFREQGFVFSIKFPGLDIDVKLAGNSNIDAEEWVDSIKKAQKDAMNKKVEDQEKELKKRVG